MAHRSALCKVVIDVGGTDADHASELTFWEASVEAEVACLHTSTDSISNTWSDGASAPAT